MNPRKPQRPVTRPRYYIGPKVTFRKIPEGRLIRVQGYPALPPVAITMACLGYMMLHSEGVWAVAGIVLLALGLMLAGPEAMLIRKFRGLRVVCGGETLRVTRGIPHFGRSVEIPLVELTGLFYFRARKDSEPDPNWGKLRAARVQVAAVDQAGNPVLIAPDLPSEQIARALVKVLGDATGLRSAGKAPSATL